MKVPAFGFSYLFPARGRKHVIVKRPVFEPFCFSYLFPARGRKLKEINDKSLFSSGSFQLPIPRKGTETNICAEIINFIVAKCFSYLFPARGRKLITRLLDTIIRYVFQLPIPRKGTETARKDITTV